VELVVFDRIRTLDLEGGTIVNSGSPSEFWGLAHATLINLFIDLRDFANPDLAFLVFHREDVIDRPVKVVSDVGHLLVDLLQGVA
jgi:hypothetical protein